VLCDAEELDNIIGVVDLLMHLELQRVRRTGGVQIVRCG
jgi:hypothetical protein